MHIPFFVTEHKNLFIGIAVVFVIYHIYLNMKVNLARRYNCKCAVVTGATGGSGAVLVEKLLKTMNVIAMDRNKAELDELALKHKSSKNQLFTFQFDFTNDLTTFEPLFNKYLIEQKISR